MDTRSAPFGEHSDGGKIRDLANEAAKDYEIELSLEAVKILENIPQANRVNYIIHSKEPELWKAREQFKKRLINLPGLANRMIANEIE